MCHGNRKSTFVMLGIAGLALASAFALGFNPAYVLILAVCPLMMFFMMRSMGGMGGGEDHTGHGCEHDPTRQDHHAEPRS
ncbi:MAG: DUF2933 domain-containing protein [Acidimicrobiales bacterium]